MLTIKQINNMDIEGINELMMKLNDRKSEIKAERLERLNERIIELHNEKNLLDKPVYSMSDIAKITKVAPSTVKKVIESVKEEEEESPDPLPHSDIK